ncbi:EamA family transporter [Parachlamydia sp. AcF125]|uniref:EamA family transporter n=1 Tax=Parachlamydia sp. AcF125 TaxID=2795736 RepID=UPI001BD82272|nr:EamA family transporter [Parachlamydia sp. AcF125]MBS4169181.1 Inner membrane protein YtfF [Parachlamydia sp. AcF125]
MFVGVFLVLVACLIWDLIFIVPLFMVGFTPLEVAVGRHFCFETLSLGILASFWWKGTFKISRSMIPTALRFALITNIIYYISLVLALRSASAAVTALICGLSPITIAIYGNIRQRTHSFKSLIIPSMLILLGLVLVNLPTFENHRIANSVEDYLFGLACAILALGTWT